MDTINSTTPQPRRRQTAAQTLATWCDSDERRAVRAAALIAQGATVARAVRAVRLSDAMQANA